MTKEEKQHFEEIIAKAVQSGKKETSNLVDEVINKIPPIIKATVNGKIDKLSEIALSNKQTIEENSLIVREYIHDDMMWKEQLKKWQEEVTPQITLVKDVQGFGKTTLGFLAFFTAIGGAILLVANLLKIKL